MINKLTDELAICGLNAALAAAEYNQENVNRLFLREDRLKLFMPLCKQLAERKRPYKICEDDELEKICKSSRHQGVVLMLKAPILEPLSRDDLEEWISEGKTGLVLHAVENDHNLGAIVRAAAFFDAPWIIIQDHFPAYTTSSYRVAEGGMEHVKLRSVRNTSAFLRDASKKLITIGTDTRARQRLKDLPAIIESKRTEKKRGIALVLGNEESGLPPDVKEACTFLVRVPGTGLMDSLNVSQAAALFLNRIYEI